MSRRVLKEEDRKRPYAPQTISGALLDVRTAAAFIGNSERSLRALIANGEIPYKKLRGRIVFRREELEKWVETLPGLSMKDVEANRKVRSKQ